MSSARPIVTSRQSHTEAGCCTRGEKLPRTNSNVPDTSNRPTTNKLDSSTARTNPTVEDEPINRKYPKDSTAKHGLREFCSVVLEGLAHSLLDRQPNPIYQLRKNNKSAWLPWVPTINIYAYKLVQTRRTNVFPGISSFNTLFFLEKDHEILAHTIWALLLSRNGPKRVHPVPWRPRMGGIFLPSPPTQSHWPTPTQTCRWPHLIRVHLLLAIQLPKATRFARHHPKMAGLLNLKQTDSPHATHSRSHV